MLVDSHCHLNFPDFREDLDAVIQRAREADVQAMQTICTEMKEFNEVLAIAEKYDGVYCSVGVHPNESGSESVPSVDELLEKTTHAKVIGLGETGLDYYYENSDRETQKQSFRAHIAAAQACGLPVIVHSRAADEDTIALLNEGMKQKYFTGVIHCFSSTKYLAEEALKLGFYISISGIATFKKSEELRDIIKEIPLERLLVETDAPYLAPTPHRGKRNEPSFVRYTNALVAELKNISEEACAKATTENFFRLFNRASSLKNPV